MLLSFIVLRENEYSLMFNLLCSFTRTTLYILVLLRACVRACLLACLRALYCIKKEFDNIDGYHHQLPLRLMRILARNRLLVVRLNNLFQRVI